MPEMHEGYFKKEPEIPVSNPAEIKNPEPDSLIEHKTDDADIDELMKKKINKADSVEEFDAMEANIIIVKEFARLKKLNEGNESYRDEEYKKEILEMAKVIVEEDNISTREATLEAMALRENGNVRKRKAIKKDYLRVVE